MIFLDYDFLIFLSENSVRLFREMKALKYEILKKYSNVKDEKDIFNIFIKDYYDFFYRYIYQNNYLIFYYIFQSHFLDPKNFELYDEDFIQDLIKSTYIAFIRYYNRYYSKENLVKASSVIDFDFFAFKNISRVMTLEFNNLKRKKINQNKGPSLMSNNSLEYSSLLEYSNYYINDELLFFEKKDFRKIL